MLWNLEEANRPHQSHQYGWRGTIACLCWLLELVLVAKFVPKCSECDHVVTLMHEREAISFCGPRKTAPSAARAQVCFSRMTKRGFLFCFWMHCNQTERLTIMNVTLGRAPFEPQWTALQPSNTSRNALIKMVWPRWLRSDLTPEAREHCHTSMRETQPNYRHESVVALKYSAPLATVAYAESMTACTGIVLTGVHCLYLSVAPTLY
jgi:hypothetical protein